MREDVRMETANPPRFAPLPRLTAIENEIPNLSVIPSELFSAEIPRRILAGDQDVGLALHAEPAPHQGDQERAAPGDAREQLGRAGWPGPVTACSPGWTQALSRWRPL